MYRFAPAAALGLLLLAPTAEAATIGSLDSSRNHAGYALTGLKYDDLRGALTAAGHEIAAATASVGASYLAGIDLFFTGLPAPSTQPSGYALGIEIAALIDWVTAGGVLVAVGDNKTFTDAANSWMEPFGLTLLPWSRNGGVWSEDQNPLLAGVAGTALEAAGAGSFAAGDYDTLARIGSTPVVVSRALGAGLVIGLGDANFFDDPAGSSGLQFFLNAAAAADARAVTPTPLPASLPLLAGAGAILVAARRLSRRT